jgi:hypothetical protein
MECVKATEIPDDWMTFWQRSVKSDNSTRILK